MTTTSYTRNGVVRHLFECHNVSFIMTGGDLTFLIRDHRTAHQYLNEEIFSEGSRTPVKHDHPGMKEWPAR